MASGLCHVNDTDPSSHNHTPRWPEDGKDDGSIIPQGHRTYRPILQPEFDLRQPHVSLPQRRLYPDAQGEGSRHGLGVYMLTWARQATMPVAVLLAGYALGVSKPNFKVLFNVSFIVIGVILASFGEIKFVLVGFLFQAGGIVFESVRLVLVQQLLSSAEYKMDPLVSLYYFAPLCAFMNLLVSLVFEVPKIHLADLWNVGIGTLLANAMVAFALNVSLVFLVRAPLPDFHYLR